MAQRVMPARLAGHREACSHEIIHSQGMAMHKGIKLAIIDNSVNEGGI